MKEFLSRRKKSKFGTIAGSAMHSRLQFIVIDKNIDNLPIMRGDTELIKSINSHSELVRFFVSSARVEVPIAGIVDGKFVSRRIDRMIIDDKEIEFLDYKTDTDKNARRGHYESQMQGYKKLLCAAYPEHKISGYILWLHDWTLERII
ncbi:MAG: hypothetical protein LBJ18_03810 [Rickettsiales bacterium]|nr:hypothetical protein [Rickettsiales bacterium]